MKKIQQQQVKYCKCKKQATTYTAHGWMCTGCANAFHKQVLSSAKPLPVGMLNRLRK